MQTSSDQRQALPSAATRSPDHTLDSSSEDLDEIEICIDQEFSDLDDFSTTDNRKKPHFLDYDYENHANVDGLTTVVTPKPMATPSSTDSCYPGEQIKVDKRLERDGEVSDYELIATNSKKLYKKETVKHGPPPARAKKKHFLDENPIPPAPEVVVQKCREHRSLDRTFDRNLMDEFAYLKYERKHSLDRELPRRRAAGLKIDHNYSLSRYIESVDAAPTMDGGAFHGGTWPAEQPQLYAADMKYASLPSSAMHTSNGSANDLGPKVECVYSLLSMLGSHDSLEMSTKFLELSKNRETCAALRRSGCIPLLVQIMHSDPDLAARKKAGQALHNVVHCHPDDKAGRREARVLRLIEQLIEYCDSLREKLTRRDGVECEHSLEDDRHPIQAIGTLMKTSFDEEHRHAMTQLGALQTISHLVQLDHACHGSSSLVTGGEPNQNCITLRRYAGMTLTNLTFGDGNNKALLCSNKGFMQALVRQIESQSDELVQVTASVLRNLSWRADSNMKAVLNEIGTVKILTVAAMRSKMENTLKAILSALWNLSNHCPTNKAEFCEVDGAIEFLIDMLNYDAASKTMAVIENAGGILRNVSSHLATKEEYRKRLRTKNCFAILLQQLKSPSLTVVSNACGTLGNLSANCFEDQKFLRDNGAIPMLRSLIYSKHKMISTGSTIALKHLLNSNKSGMPGSANTLDSVTKSLDLKELPSLNVRKQRALEQELDQNLAVRSCTSSSGSDDLLMLTKGQEEATKTKTGASQRSLSASGSAAINKSESRDSLLSAKSDSMYERLQRQQQKSGEPERATRSSEYIETLQEVAIDYSIKFKEGRKAGGKVQGFGDYQETDLDQPTDYSLRYAENQDQGEESDETEEATAAAKIVEKPLKNVIMLAEDSLKCYYTEGTPRIISSATSMNDLRNASTKEKPAIVTEKPEAIEMPPPRAMVIEKVKKEHVTFGSGTQSPEKPISYCDEGTPGVFSRYDSLNSLIDTVDLQPTSGEVRESVKITTTIVEATGGEERHEAMTPPLVKDTLVVAGVSQPTTPGGSKSVTFIDFAEETPLMFSRTSSIGSLASAEPFCTDDKSSVVSEFSRLASGILSPSEVPDSPTQSIPQSPRRTTMHLPPIKPPVAAPRLRSVFEDNTNAFGVENTPMQFSCATSLSNLSLDDEPKITTDTLTKEMRLMNHPSEEQEDQVEEPAPALVENHEEPLTDGEESSVNDEMLLESCINIGMNRVAGGRQSAVPPQIPNNDSCQQYCTEDTPALLSKTGSNTNLSILSLDTNKGETVLSDDSSNTSDVGNDELLKECIQVGMPKPSTSRSAAQTAAGLQQKPKPKERRSLAQFRQMSLETPLDKLRNGGGFGTGGPSVIHQQLPPYLPVKDELNKFLVEDSPCNFSTASVLSDLTVGSSVAKLKRSPQTTAQRQLQASQSLVPPLQGKDKKLKSQTYDDSLSSLSIESEGEDLLTQAIAAGVNATKPGKSKDPFVGAAKVSLPGPYKTNQQNDSLSSVGSSCDLNQDDDDQQTNSLLQQCIQSGINSVVSGGGVNNLTTFMIPKIIQAPKLPMFEPLPQTSGHLKPAVTPGQLKSPTKPATSAAASKDFRHKERQRKDEQLLKEIISNGIAHATNVDSNTASPLRHFLNPVPPPRQILQPAVDLTNRIANLSVEPVTTNPRVSNSRSKNGKSTSVIVVSDHQPEPSSHITSRASTIKPNHTTYTGVESTESPNEVNDNIGTTNRSDNSPSQRPSCIINSNNNSSNHSINNSTPMGSNDKSSSSPGATRKSGQPLVHQPPTHQNGFDDHHDNLLERSNEYPALQMNCSQFTFTDDESDAIDCTGGHNRPADPNSSTSQIMELSNEFLVEQSISENGDCLDGNTAASKIMNKHKDPDLMLQSVERLTQELVSQAEYLRTSNNDDDDTTTSTSNKLANGGNIAATLLEVSQSQHHTWEEDTCPNDVSFPSLSVTAPMITSIEDDNTFSEFNFRSNGTSNGPIVEDLDEPTPTNETKTFLIGRECSARVLTNGVEMRDNSREKSGIQFQVGGEVCTSAVGASLQYLSSGSGPYSFDNSSTTLTNSTMIHFEANRLAQDFDCFAGMQDSTTSLDLDNIRPPSAMDCVSLSTVPPGGGGSCSASPQMSRKVFRKKSLPSGLIAKRALLTAATNSQLGQFAASTGGSVESINLDNIKPPSIMDELMDSMISVDSIESEIADNNLLTTATSHYETAMSEMTLNGGDDDDDDNTTTLQSCYTDFQLPADGSTPIPSDGFSSAESTPVRKVKNAVKKAMTPRQKRKMEKTRFRTYTIAADRALNDLDAATDPEENVGQEEDEVLLVVNEAKSSLDSSPSSTHRQLTPRQKRREDRARFETQILDPAHIPGSPSSLSDHSRDSPKRRQENPDRFKTQTIEAMQIDTVTYSIEPAEPVVDPLPTEMDCLSLLSNETVYDDDDASIRAMTEQFKYIREVVAPQPVPMPPSASTVSYIRAVQKLMVGSGATGSTGEPPLKLSPVSDVVGIVKPRIVKPLVDAKPEPDDVQPTGDEELQGAETTAKAVRGRKKPAYVSPYRKSVTSTPQQRPKSTPSMLPSRTTMKSKSVSPSPPAKNQTLVAKTHVFVNKSNYLKKGMHGRPPAVAATPTKPKNGMTVIEKNTKNLNGRPKSAATVVQLEPQPAQRQGTFIKEEPSHPQLPVVVSAPPTPSKSRLPSKIPASKTSASPQPPSTPTASKPGFVSKLRIPLQKSISTTDAKRATTPTSSTKSRNFSVYKSPSVPSVPMSQRSNSNSSIKSTAKQRLSVAPGRSHTTIAPTMTKTPAESPTPPPPKKDITSRISSIWKKIDESKKKQDQQKKDNRIWIGKNGLQEPATTVAPPTPAPLIRSSTFDSSPPMLATESAAVVTMRKTKDNLVNGNELKRISRLGSFVNVEGEF